MLAVVYLVFNEGHAATAGSLLRLDLCAEAIRLARVLAELMPDEPEAQGLLALLLLLHARRAARVAADGSLARLAEQDRRLWDRDLITEGQAIVRACVQRDRPGPYGLGTFRLQLFTAAGARPVAIATHTAGEGASLTNRAERYAADVWRRHFPGLAEPPVWIELQLFPDIPGHPERFTLVTFSRAQPHELAGPRWCRMNDADVARLVGAAVDRGRGDGYQPWPTEPEEQPVYQVVWVALLPRPDGVDRGCMNGAAPWRRCLGRQLVPRRGTRDCCYYHSIDWHLVSAAAIRIARQVRGEGLAGEALAGRAASLARAEDLPPPERRAVTELVECAGGIQIDRGVDGRRFYINGRHRTTAMLDAGVRRTVVIRWQMPESAEPSQ